MKKMCAQCGGSMKKMAKGGSTTNKLNNARGFAKPTTGGSNTKDGIYAVPNAGPTGPNRTGTYDYKKGGSIGKAKFGAATPVKASCKKGQVRSASGTCVSERPKFAKGGSISQYQNGGKVKAIKPKTAFEKSVDNMGGPDKPPMSSPVKMGSDGAYRKKPIVDQPAPKRKYAKGGSSFGMLSVKAGVDKNPKPTQADRIAGAKMKKGGVIKSKKK